MRVLLHSGFILASLGVALAHSDINSPALPTTTSLTTNSYKLSPIEEASLASSAHFSSLSSRFGSFFETLIFAPALPSANWGVYISPIASNAETTTYVALQGVESRVEKTTVRAPSPYLSFTLGPTTFLHTRSSAEWLVPVSYSATSSITIAAADVTTHCSYTTTPPALPIPASIFTTLIHGDGVTTLIPDNWPTHSAVCTEQGSYISRFSEVVTYSLDGWRLVTVLGQEAPATVTGEDGAKHTGSKIDTAKATSTSDASAAVLTAWVRGVVVVAAAAVMAT